MRTARFPFNSLLTLVFIAACSGCDNSVIPKDTAAIPTTQAGPLRVKAVSPVVTTLRRMTTQPVTVFPFHEANIEAKVSGYLTQLNVDIGDHVEEGDVLAVLDVPEMVKEMEEQHAVIARLKAEEKQAAADVTLSEANVDAAKSSLAQMESEILKAEADLKAAQAEFRRIEDLVSRGSVEARMEDEVRQRQESAQASKSAAEASLTTARANVAVAEAKLEASRAEVERSAAETVIAEKQLEKMQTLMQYASLRAPFNGVVTSRNVDLGDLVSNSQSAGGRGKPLFTIAQLDHVRVQAAIPESDAPWINVGDAATVHLSALRGQTFSGTVSRITQSLDASTRTMQAEVDLDNSDGRLLPGMYGEATFVLDERTNSLVLPAGSVRFDAEGNAYVYTADREGIVQNVSITIGIDSGRELEVVSGLSTDARVIDGMLDRLAAGDKVQIDE